MATFRGKNTILDRTLVTKEVNTLEELLEDNFGFREVFKQDGTLSINGERAYEFLVQVIINLGNIGLYRPHECSKILRRLEYIVNEPDVILEEDD